MVKIIDSKITDTWAIYNGDCCDILKGIPDDSIGYSIFSPPFAELYAYSSEPRDMGNSSNYAEFFAHFGYLLPEIMRTISPGRNVSVHCIDIPAMKERDGYIGLKDFPGDIIRAFEECGFIFHSRHTIWKDPLIEATRTKAIGLMHKQLKKDSARCRAGLPDYILTFRKPGDNHDAIAHTQGLAHYVGSDDPGGAGEKRSQYIWRAYASPVWMDIRQTRTLNFRGGRDVDDQKHICPLQLDVIERCLTLWSNPGDVVMSPFMGVGSEIYGALQLGRKGIGIELKSTYYRQALVNISRLQVTQDTLL